MRRLLFYGELPPNAIHGIAYSSMINLEILRRVFEVIVVEEKSTFSSGRFFKKTSGRFHELLSIIKKSVSCKFEFFYTVLSISTIGSIKTIFSIIVFILFNKGKVILHIHRGDFLSWYNARGINRLLAGIIIKMTDRVIVLSESQKIEFKKLFKVPVYVLHNSIEFESASPLNKKGRQHFIYISNYLVEKGIFDLLDVFIKLKERYNGITLHTYGAFPSTKIKDRILKYNSPGIVINDIITGNKKFNDIGNADCLILPSHNEGEPVILLEAMSLGTPVISTATGLIPEMLGPDYPFISIPKSLVSLEEKIEEFINYPYLDKLSMKLKVRYFQNYSNKVHSLNLLEIFK